MSFQTALLDALRAEGLTVREVNGWRTRGGETFSPDGGVNHHTAVGGTAVAPSLGICTNGRGTPGTANYLPGPLCNVLQSREVDGHGLDVVYLIAAGRANHAGSGNFRGLTGNSKVFGLEVEHRGTPDEPFSIKRRETSIRVHAAFAKVGRYGADMVCQHREWAPGRKVDFVAALLDAASFRRSLAQHLAGPPPAPAPAPQPHVPEDDMIIAPDWIPVATDGPFKGRDVVYAPFPVDSFGKLHGFRLVSFNGAPFFPAWADQQQGVDQVAGLNFKDEVFFGFWSRVYVGTTGPYIGTYQKQGRFAVACGGGGTYTVARKP